MYSVRKILAVVLALAMVLAMSVSAFAAQFSDLEGCWAQKDIERLVALGMLNGYSDGTMKPNKDISVGEAIAFLSRFYKLTDEEYAALYEDYGAKAEALASGEWLYKPMAIALATGIVTESEVKDRNLSLAISREELGLLIVRAIEMDDTAEALADTELKYTDTATIGSKYRGSAALLTQIGIIKGTLDGRYDPKTAVNRATVATMISRIIDYLDEQGTELVVPGYTGLGYTEGIITDVSSKGITLRDMDGVYHFYKLASGFTATVNGKAKAMSTSYIGDKAMIRVVDGKANGAVIDDYANVEFIQGELSYVDSRNCNIRIYNYEDGKSSSYNVVQAEISLDGEVTPLAKLPVGSFVTMKSEGQVTTEVMAVSKEAVISGKVSAIEYGSTVIVSMEAEDESTTILRLNLSDMPAIKRGAIDVGVDKIAVGDNIKVTVKGGIVDSIAMDVSTATVSGTLTAITTTADGTRWTITRADGTQKSYALAKNAVAHNGKNVIKASAIEIGDEISIVVFDDEISEINLDKVHTGVIAEGTKLSVKVLNVDTKERKIAALTEESKLIYLDCDTLASVVVAETGRTVSLTYIEEGYSIVAYGSYGEDGSFVAKSIIIEGK